MLAGLVVEEEIEKGYYNNMWMGWVVFLKYRLEFQTKDETRVRTCCWITFDPGTRREVNRDNDRATGSPLARSSRSFLPSSRRSGVWQNTVQGKLYLIYCGW